MKAKFSIDGIIGHRSWLAQALISSSRSSSFKIIHKNDVEETNMSNSDLVFCFPGRAKGDSEDRRKELRLVRSLCRLDPAMRPRRLLYISSQDVHLATHYGELKRQCETLLQETYPSYGLIIVRPPAIFGEGQRFDSDMLIPSVVRHGFLDPTKRFSARTPDQKSKFVHVDRFVEFLRSFASHDRGGIYDKVPGQFCMRPRDVIDLFRSFNGLQQRLTCWTCGGDGVVDESDRTGDAALRADVITEHRSDR